MSVPPEQFSRIAGRVDLALLKQLLVAVVGVGTVGSQLARELANSGLGRLRLIDGDYLERHNLPRHALTAQYVGWNKARAMSEYLVLDVPHLHVEAVPLFLDESMTDAAVDRLLMDAHLIVLATDNRSAQRRLARRALSLDVPAVLPGLYAGGGGEAFVQGGSNAPCFFCWDGFRHEDVQLRAVTALNAEGLAVLQLAVELSLGILDPRSSFARLLAGSADDPRMRQVFIQEPRAALSLGPAMRRPDCPSCRVGPPRPSPGQQTTPPQATQGTSASARPPGEPTQISSWQHKALQVAKLVAIGLVLAFVVILVIDPHLAGTIAWVVGINVVVLGGIALWIMFML